MHHSSLMRVIKGAGNLHGEGQGLRHRNRSLPESCLERVAVNQVEDDAVNITVAREPVDGADVRMVQRCQQACLALEPRESLRIVQERRRQELDGDVPMEGMVIRAVDLAHAACADARANFVGADSDTN